MDTVAIRSQQAAGFRYLRFSPELETDYRSNRAAAVRERARLVSAAGLLIFGIFVLLDLAMLPPDLARITAAIRLWVTCPVIALVWWLSYCQRPGNLGFERLYTLAYLIGGLSVVAIIATARLRDFPLPYEGMLLMLMFGYFAMGLPFFSASIASAVIIAAYLVAELSIGLTPGTVMVNLFFVLTANTIGMVGAWLSEYRHRAHFLDQQLISLLHQNAAEESERKSHLITVASHDLRQPLNIIGLTLENLSAARLAPEQRGLVRRLQGSVGHFQRLLGTVLDISRINEGMIQPQNDVVDVNSLLDQLVDLTVDHAHLHSIRLDRATGEPGIQAMADPDLLLRALQNLVFNAIDHSGGNEVRIATALQGSQVRIDVSDNGVGLDEQFQHLIFQPFIRGDKARDNPAGLGLGLAIVKELAGMIGGSCGVRSVPGAGSTFWIGVRLATTSPATEVSGRRDLDIPVTASPAGVPD